MKIDKKNQNSRPRGITPELIAHRVLTAILIARVRLFSEILDKSLEFAIVHRNRDSEAWFFFFLLIRPRWRGSSLVRDSGTKVNVNISAFVSFARFPDAREGRGGRVESSKMLREAKLGRHLRVWLYFIATSLVWHERNVSLIRVSRGESRRLFCGSPHFCLAGFLNVLRVGRKLNAKDRRIRRVSLCKPGVFIWAALCAVYEARLVSLLRSLVTKLSLPTSERTNGDSEI